MENKMPQQAKLGIFCLVVAILLGLSIPATAQPAANDWWNIVPLLETECIPTPQGKPLPPTVLAIAFCPSEITSEKLRQVARSLGKTLGTEAAKDQPLADLLRFYKKATFRSSSGLEAVLVGAKQRHAADDKSEILHLLAAVIIEADFEPEIRAEGVSIKELEGGKKRLEVTVNSKAILTEQTAKQPYEAQFTASSNQHLYLLLINIMKKPDAITEIHFTYINGAGSKNDPALDLDADGIQDGCNPCKIEKCD